MKLLKIFLHKFKILKIVTRIKSEKYVYKIQSNFPVLFFSLSRHTIDFPSKIKIRIQKKLNLDKIIFISTKDLSKNKIFGKDIEFNSIHSGNPLECAKLLLNFKINEYLLVIDETIYPNLGVKLTSREFYTQFFEELINLSLNLDLDFNIIFLFNNNRIFSSSNPVEYLTYEHIFDISKKMNLSFNICLDSIILTPLPFKSFNQY